MTVSTTETYRCYHFNNFYLAGIHAGIQAGHAQHELAWKYLLPVIDGEIRTNNVQANMYREWAEHHKTMILLNAGMAKDLEELAEFANEPPNLFPWVAWRESEEALNGCITSVAMVLPERIYGWSQQISKAWYRSPHQGELHRMDNPNYLLLKSEDGSAKVIGAHSGHYFQEYGKFEVDLMLKMAGMRLFS